MSISTILTDIAGGLTAFLPTLGKAMLDTFLSLFFTATTAEQATTYTLNPLGTIALVWMCIGLSKVLVSAVSGWLHLGTRIKGRKRARARKAA